MIDQAECLLAFCRKRASPDLRPLLLTRLGPPPGGEETEGLLPRPAAAAHLPIMPSHQKRLVFSVSGLLSFLCALTAAVATGLPAWLRGAVLCRTGAELVNATGPELDKFLGDLSYGLFHGVRVKQCGLGGRASRFSCEFCACTPDTQVGEQSDVGTRRDIR